MRQFNYDITQAVRNGLLRRDRVTRNEPFLSVFLGFQVDDDLITSIDYPNREVSSYTFTGNLPFIRLFDSGFFLFQGVSIDKITIDQGTVTSETLTFEDSFIPNPQEYYDVASFLDTWYAFTGDYIYKYNGTTIEVTEKAVRTGCTHKSRILFGGVESDFLDGFDSYIFDIAKKVDVPHVFGSEVNPNTIFWTAPQSDDWLRWIKDASSMTTGSNEFDLDTYETELYRSEIIDVLQRGNTGFYTLPSDCTLVKVISVGENIYAFTDNGLFILGFQTIGNVDVLSKKARLPIIVTDRNKIFSNSEGASMFCDDLGTIYIITDGVSKLGYQSIMSKYLDEQWSISYSNKFEGYIISIGSITKYILSKGVLSSFFSEGTYLVNSGYEEFFFVPDIELIVRDKRIIKTSAIDFVETGQKTITEIHLAGNWDGEAYAFIEWKNENMAEFKRVRPVVINKQGWCSIRVNAKEFKIGLEFVNSTYVEIDEWKVSYQADDKRYKRGINAGSIDS